MIMDVKGIRAKIREQKGKKKNSLQSYVIACRIQNKGRKSKSKGNLSFRFIFIDWILSIYVEHDLFIHKTSKRKILNEFIRIILNMKKYRRTQENEYHEKKLETSNKKTLLVLKK